MVLKPTLNPYNSGISLVKSLLFKKGNGGLCINDTAQLTPSNRFRHFLSPLYLDAAWSPRCIVSVIHRLEGLIRSKLDICLMAVGARSEMYVLASKRKDHAEGFIAQSHLQEMELGEGRLFGWPWWRKGLLKVSSEDACCCSGECPLSVLSQFSGPAGRHTYSIYTKKPGESGSEDVELPSWLSRVTLA